MLKRLLIFTILVYILAPLTKCLSRPETELFKKSYKDYTVTASKKHSDDTETRLTISKNGERLLQLIGKKSSFEIVESGYGFDASMGEDITGDGKPNLVVKEWTGGKSCCALFHIFEIGEEFRHIQTFDNGGGDVFPFTNDSEGTALEFIKYEWSSYTGSSPMPDLFGAEVFYKYNGTSYEVAHDLMRYSPPIEQDVKKWASKLRATYSLKKPESRFYIELEISKRLTYLIYSGNIRDIRRVMDLAWPSYMPGMDIFMTKYRSSIMGSPYWVDLKIINDIDEWNGDFSVNNPIEYSREQLKSCIGDPNHPHEAPLAGSNTVLFIDEHNNVAVRDEQSNTSRVIKEFEPGGWGTMGEMWVTPDRGVFYVHDGKLAISVTTESAGGITTLWDTETWEDVSLDFWPNDYWDDGHIKVSPNGRYAVVAGDGPKFGSCLSLIDFEKSEYRLLSGMKWKFEDGDHEAIEATAGLAHSGGNFRLGFTPDSQRLVLETGANSFQLYDMCSRTTTSLSFKEKQVNDPRYLEGNRMDYAYDFKNPEFGEDPCVARIKVFQKAMKNERLDVVARYFDFPFTRGEFRIYSVNEFVEHFDEMFPEKYRLSIAEEKEISLMGSHGYMIGNGSVWFDILGMAVTSNY